MAVPKLVLCLSNKHKDSTHTHTHTHTHTGPEAEANAMLTRDYPLLSTMINHLLAGIFLTFTPTQWVAANTEFQRFTGDGDGTHVHALAYIMRHYPTWCAHAKALSEHTDPQILVHHLAQGTEARLAREFLVSALFAN